MIRKLKVTDAFKFQVQEEDNPTIKEKQWSTDEWLRKIDISGLPGKLMSWIYQHGLLPRLM